MAKDRDDQLNQEGGFSLEEILAEFGSKGRGQGPASAEPPAPAGSAERAAPKAPPKASEPPKPTQAPEGRDWREDTIPFPVRPVERRTSPGGRKGPGVVTAFPGAKLPREEPKPAPPPEPEEPAEEPEKPEKVQEVPAEEPRPPAEDKVLEFPAPEPENPVAAGIDKLRRKADDFAGHMFEDEGKEADPSIRRAEKLIPGVDWEEPPAPTRERKPRRKLPPPPDVAPGELAKRYHKGLKAFRVRLVLGLFVVLALVYLALAESLPLVLPEPLASDQGWRCYAQGALQALLMLLGIDTLGQALARPFRSRTGLDTLTALGNLAVLADALTLPSLSVGALQRRPLCAAAALGLWCVMWGNLQKRRGQRLACRTAASTAEPYLVTRDEGAWNGRDTYAKWSGPPVGFGSQIQGLDGAERIYRVAAPLLLIACILFALMASLGRERPEDFLWCLGAILTAAAPLSATLCFGQPWRKLSARLARSGAALAGWEGITSTTGSTNLLLTDTDLFPAGSVAFHGVKIFGDFPIDKVVAVTATVIRDAGSGLEKIFHDLLRSQGAIYRRGEKFTVYEGGGASEIIRDELVLVGSAPFMVLMDVALPQGLNMKNAVFCAIDGELAGIFALNYHLSGAVAPAVDSLIRSRITPVLATRDFNLIPSMLRQRFKLPVDKMEFPSVERRRELSQEGRPHSDTLTAVLCREGISPYAEAVVGGRRLRSAVRLSAVLACLASLVGALLGFYLAFMAAYDSLTTVNLLIFLLMWLVPAPLISGWVDRY